MAIEKSESIKEIAKAEGIISAIGDGISIIDRTFKVSST